MWEDLDDSATGAEMLGDLIFRWRGVPGDLLSCPSRNAFKCFLFSF